MILAVPIKCSVWVLFIVLVHSATATEKWYNALAYGRTKWQNKYIISCTIIVYIKDFANNKLEYEMNIIFLQKYDCFHPNILLILYLPFICEICTAYFICVYLALLCNQYESIKRSHCDPYSYYSILHYTIAFFVFYFTSFVCINYIRQNVTTMFVTWAHVVFEKWNEKNIMYVQIVAVSFVCFFVIAICVSVLNDIIRKEKKNCCYFCYI